MAPNSSTSGIPAPAPVDVDVLPLAGGSNQLSSGGKAPRTNPHRSARRFSPFGKPPSGPSSTGLSGAMGSVALGSTPGSGPTRRSAAKEASSRWNTPMDECLWDVSTRVLDHPDASMASGGGEAASKRRLWSLIRARVDARAEIRSIDEWRGKLIDQFLVPSTPQQDEKRSSGGGGRCQRRAKAMAAAGPLPPLSLPPPAPSSASLRLGAGGPALLPQPPSTQRPAGQPSRPVRHKHVVGSTARGAEADDAGRGVWEMRELHRRCASACEAIDRLSGSTPRRD